MASKSFEEMESESSGGWSQESLLYVDFLFSYRRAGRISLILEFFAICFIYSLFTGSFLDAASWFVGRILDLDRWFIFIGLAMLIFVYYRSK